MRHRGVALHSDAGLPTLVLCVAFALTIAGCTKEAARVADASPRFEGTGSASVKYAQRVRLMDEAQARRSLLATDSTGAALLFEQGDRTAATLAPGDVLVVKGLLARKVLAAETGPLGVVVLTVPAALSEVIEQGSIRVQGSTHFAGAAPPRRAQDFLHVAGRIADTLVGRAFAQDPAEVRRQAAEVAGRGDALGKAAANIARAAVQGWAVAFSADPQPGRVNLALTATKEVGGFKAVVKGDGYLADFDFDSAIDIDQGITQRIGAGLRKVNGLMNVTWELGKESPGGLTESARIKLPASVSIPLAPLLDGLPLFLEISAAVILHPVITGGQQYSRGAFRLTYDGYQSFKLEEGTIDANGVVSGDIKLLEHQNISALAPMGMVVAFAAPRVELGFGVSKLFEMDQIKAAAGKVDQIAEQLARRVLTPAQYQRFHDSPMASFSFAKSADMALKSDAAAYFEVVTTSSLSNSGMSAITPCTRSDLGLAAKVGASATAFGQTAGKAEKTIFEKKASEIEPRGTALCENLAG